MTDESNTIEENVSESEAATIDSQETAAEPEAVSEVSKAAQQQVEGAVPIEPALVAQDSVQAAATAPTEPEKPKKKRKGLLIGVIIALVLVAGGGGFYFLGFAPAANYDQAVKAMNQKDYASAVATFSSMPGYRDSMSNIYEIYKDIAGQSYIDEATAGVSYMTNYINAQSKDMLSTMLGAYRSTGDTTWSPNTEDANLKAMVESADKLREKKSKFDKTFTPAVIEACGDKTLSDACDQFKELHSATVSLLNTGKAMTYITGVAQGSTSTMNADVTKVTSAFTPYERTINSMK